MIGDMNDMLVRLKSLLPPRWFADKAPMRDAVLTGLASAWSGIYSLLTKVRAQTRIATASGVFLDIAAQDYFGGALPRRAAEADTAYSQRIRDNLLSPRATRAAVTQALVNLTGRTPAVFEPRNATDTGGYSVNLGYNMVGGYGSLKLPYQFMVTAYRPNSLPVSNAGGYDVGPGGYNTGPLAYADMSEFAGTVSDGEIYAAIAAVTPTTSIAWTKISN